LLIDVREHGDRAIRKDAGLSQAPHNTAELVSVNLLVLVSRAQETEEIALLVERQRCSR
jgi:hypothetical protein